MEALARGETGAEVADRARRAARRLKWGPASLLADPARLALYLSRTNWYLGFLDQGSLASRCRGSFLYPVDPAAAIDAAYVWRRLDELSGLSVPMAEVAGAVPLRRAG